MKGKYTPTGHDRSGVLAGPMKSCTPTGHDRSDVPPGVIKTHADRSRPVGPAWRKSFLIRDSENCCARCSLSQIPTQGRFLTIKGHLGVLPRVSEKLRNVVLRRESFRGASATILFRFFLVYAFISEILVVAWLCSAKTSQLRLRGEACS